MTFCGGGQFGALTCQGNCGPYGRIWDKEAPPVAVAKRTYLTKHLLMVKVRLTRG